MIHQVITMLEAVFHKNDLTKHLFSCMIAIDSLRERLISGVGRQAENYVDFSRFMVEIRLLLEYNGRVVF